MENNSFNSENDGFTKAPTNQGVGQNPNEMQDFNQSYMYDQNGAPQQGGNGMAIAGMVLGIISLVCCCSTYISMIAGVAGLVLSIIVLVQKKPGKGMAIAGVICSGIAVALGIIGLIGLAVIGSNSDLISQEILDSLQESGFDVDDWR